MLGCQCDKVVLFPAFSSLARKILILPIGIAEVERSFSTMNRILCSERCRLLPERVDMLMKLSIEGPAVPDGREGDKENDEAMINLTDTAYRLWLKKPRR